MLAFRPKFMEQAFLGQTDVQQARGGAQLLVDSVDFSISALPEGPIKKDFSERLTGCQNLLRAARDLAAVSLAQTCLTLLREDVSRAPTTAVNVAYATIFGVPTWGLIVGVAAAVGIGFLISESSEKTRISKPDKHIEVDPRKDGTCRKGSRHIRSHSGCWKAKTLD